MYSAAPGTPAAEALQLLRADTDIPTAVATTSTAHTLNV
jgi:hypothetical protein